MYVTVFSILVKNDYKHFASSYLLSDEGKQILSLLVDGYNDSSIALNCGIMLRETIMQRCIHEYFLDNPEVIKPIFTKHAHSSTFEITSDAISTIQYLLRQNKQLVSKKMNANGPLYKVVFEWYGALISSEEYVTRRMSLQVRLGDYLDSQLLNEFLLDKVNFDIMIAYIGDVKNLMSIMQVLRTPQAMIQYEAFHVFKVFVANPDKTPEVITILTQNADKLINYLIHFLPEKGIWNF